MSSKTYLVLAAVVTMTASAAAGHAASQPLNGVGRVVVQVRVPVGDLDLTSEAGADTLLQRVRVAAARLCRPAAESGISYPDAARAQRACRDRALTNAVAAISSPVVQARYADQGRPHAVKVVAEAQP